MTKKIELTPGTEKTGGDVNHYLVNITDPKRLAPYMAEAEDIIEALDMTFSEGNVFKALWRSCAARAHGLEKEGQDPDGVYDGDKIAYYGARTAAVRKRKQFKRLALQRPAPKGGKFMYATPDHERVFATVLHVVANHSDGVITKDSLVAYTGMKMDFITLVETICVELGVKPMTIKNHPMMTVKLLALDIHEMLKYANQ